jgi:hypothetical protein
VVKVGVVVVGGSWEEEERLRLRLRVGEMERERELGDWERE